MLLLIYLCLDRAKKSVYLPSKSTVHDEIFQYIRKQLSTRVFCTSAPLLTSDSDAGNIENREEFVSFLESEEAAVQKKSTQGFLMWCKWGLLSNRDSSILDI